MIDKNQAIINYLTDTETGCPLFKNNPLYFNFSEVKNDNSQLITLSNETNINKPFIDGSVLKRYTFIIVNYKSMSYIPIVPSKSNENVEDLFDVASIIEWISEQNDNKHFPNFGENCEVESVQALSDNPNLNGIDSSFTPAMAKYSVSIQVDYLDKNKMVWNLNL